MGRGWLHVAGAVQKAFWLPFAWQAQYTEPPEGAAARVGVAGPRLASRGRRSTQSLLKGALERLPGSFAQAQPPGGAAARVFTPLLSVILFHNFIILLPHHLCQVPSTARNDDA